ncbi:phospholipase effector Tle1 domain-containing protein [Pseudomonas sp. NPDC090592]|uniref:phospholipase effector Tle1 domain-containing protein n=1 Tax=Pseudomonas sp. NPDC090592 TaxID=3364480 RepID=UPI00383BAAE6
MSKTVYFSVYFDGTANSKDNDKPLGSHTNVARLYECDAAKGTNLSRNSGHEAVAYEPAHYLGLSEKIYFDGVGSHQRSTPIALIERGTGRGSENRIEQAYEAVVAFCNKNHDLQVDLNVIGFSRGAAQARALANVIIDRGVPKLDSQWKATREYLIPPGQAQVNKLAIFDTVASYGVPITESHTDKNLEISKNVKSTTHLVAMHEYRTTFPLTSALRNDDNSRTEEVRFAGAHSQVGGGYRNDLLAAGPLAFMYDRLKSAGVELGPLPPEEMKRIEQYNALIKHPDRLQEALIDSRLLKGNEAFKREANGSWTVLNNRPFPTERGTANVLGWKILGPLDWQTKPFDHAVNGRKVIFENDGSRGEPVIRRIGKELGQNFLGWSDKVEGSSSLPDYQPDSSVSSTVKARKKRFEAEEAEQSRRQVAELSSLLADSKPKIEHIQRLGLEEVPLPTPSLLPKYAVLRIDHQGSSAFADLGFEYEASRIVEEAGDSARNRAPLRIDDPIMLRDTNGNVVGSLEAAYEAPAFAAESGVLIAVDMQHVAQDAQAGLLHDGLKQAAQWIAERPEGRLTDDYEIPGEDGKPLVRARVACPVTPELQRTVSWQAPEP